MTPARGAGGVVPARASRSLKDPYGTVLLKAAAAALSISRPHSGATGDLVARRRDGLVREPRDHNSLVQAMIALADEAALRMRPGSAAHALRAPDGSAEAVRAVLRRTRSGQPETTDPNSD